MNTKPRISGDEGLDWFKSSYSSDEGGACIEVAFAWRKSSYSGDDGGACVEVATCPDTIHVRDSKLELRGPRLDVTPAAWAEFTSFVAGA
ncbi:DUF397 domain-containing protein [Streptomyces hesseae]|uniref:DUF397 domain-containing protein n=1 Tax=Streptomyces hesseae TaxID=3075519 RepID=A0ABU2SWR2_9ACTN|nr:DUF397 domain-containing protein [Streptomyces sp. DSM 40473]MDT0453431.1 DUF397 domain-containing protein [Streptomyces sp. DSM 40473]